MYSIISLLIRKKWKWRQICYQMRIKFVKVCVEIFPKTLRFFYILVPVPKAIHEPIIQLIEKARAHSSPRQYTSGQNLKIHFHNETLFYHKVWFSHQKSSSFECCY